MSSKEINIKVENVGKKYRLGVLGAGTIRDDVQNWWLGLRGKSKGLVTEDGKEQKDAKGDFWALKDISFDVRKGEILGIVGKNGAGKSTLLKLLSQISTPTEGEIKIKGKVASLLEVGTGFHPELTGRENIFLNGAILGMTKKEINNKLNDIIEFSGIKYHIDTPVKRYSSGMKVRLGFAVAAHLEPEILIIDEVLAVGDAEFQKKCLGKMQDVAGAGRTVLFVSHNMEAVQNLCTRAILLEQGRVTKTGTAEEIVEHYLSGMMEKTEKIKHTFDAGDKKYYIENVEFITTKQIPAFSSFEKVEIKIDFVIPEESADLDLNISFFNKQGKLFMFFASDLVKKGSGQSTPFSPGRNSVILTIPAGTLNKGDYSINLLLHKSYYDFLDSRKEEVTFRVITNDERFAKYPGVPTGPVNIK